MADCRRTARNFGTSQIMRADCMVNMGHETIMTG